MSLKLIYVMCNELPVLFLLFSDLFFIGKKGLRKSECIEGEFYSFIYYVIIYFLSRMQLSAHRRDDFKLFLESALYKFCASAGSLCCTS